MLVLVLVVLSAFFSFYGIEHYIKPPQTIANKYQKAYQKPIAGSASTTHGKTHK
jgi:hypothetical protein